MEYRLLLLALSVIIPSYNAHTTKFLSKHGLLSKESSTVRAEVISGDNLAFVYDLNDVEYFFDGERAVDKEGFPNVYNISIIDENVTIRVSGGPYLFVNSSEALSTTTRELSATVFGLAIVDDTNKFNIYVKNSSSPPDPELFLVTPHGGAPFTFYLSRRYSDEPLAVFYFREMTVDEVYANKSQNINQTVAFIHSSSQDQAAAYSQLLSLMDINDHITGSDIFRVGYYISQDLGTDNPVYALLPAPVQAVFSAGGFTMSYQNSPMKYSWASDTHTNIKPYKISRHEGTGLFAITYSDNVQLRITSRNLVDVTTDDLSFIFQFRLDSDHKRIELRCYSSYEQRFETVYSDDVEPDYYFILATTLSPKFFNVFPA